MLKQILGIDVPDCFQKLKQASERLKPKINMTGYKPLAMFWHECAFVCTTIISAITASMHSYKQKWYLEQYLQTLERMTSFRRGPHSARNEGAHVWLKAFQATMSLLDLGTVALPALTL